MYPELWDSQSKDWVIPDETTIWHQIVLKGSPVWDQAIWYQVVGEVTAHQAFDA
jgi:hypothetical protein